MIFSNLNQEDKDTLDQQFQSVLYKLIDVAKYKPKEKYLYPVMRGVAFRDLEVALDIAILERAQANDN